MNIPSAARKLASQTNGRLSKGPLTAETKARSRANSLKHGMTGAGVVLPDEDVVEVSKRFDDLRAQFNPATPMGKILVHRVAFLSVRLERSGEQEAAHLRKKIRHAVDDHDMECLAKVAEHLADLDARPGLVVRRLLKTPEGIDALIAEWGGLREDLVAARCRFWTAHCNRANLLMGRKMDDIPVSRVNELSNAMWGDFSLIGPDEGAGLDDKARRAWAKERLIELIDQEVEALRNCREGLDLEGFELDREEAPQRAMFDTSLPAVLARRYEAANERGMFHALREMQRVEKEAAKNPQPYQACPVVPLGSFGHNEEAPPEPEVEPEAEADDRPSEVVATRSPALPASDRVEFREETGKSEGREGMVPRLSSVK